MLILVHLRHILIFQMAPELCEGSEHERTECSNFPISRNAWKHALNRTRILPCRVDTEARCSDENSAGSSFSCLFKGKGQDVKLSSKHQIIRQDAHPAAQIVSWGSPSAFKTKMKKSEMAEIKEYKYEMYQNLLLKSS
jgi:hypothetical protein